MVVLGYSLFIVTVMTYQQQILGDERPAKPPIASLISISEANGLGVATVTGKAGAVIGGQSVKIVNVNTGDVAFTRSSSDGSFETDIFAPESSMLHITYAPRDQFSWLDGSPATIINVHNLLVTGTTDVPFTSSRAFDEGRGHYIVTGTISSTILKPGDLIKITGRLLILHETIDEIFDINSMNISLSLGIFRLFDQDGRQIAIDNLIVSNRLTPSGLPILGDTHHNNRMEIGGIVISSRSLEMNTNGITTNFEITGRMDRNLPDGIYKPDLGITIHAGNMIFAEDSAGGGEVFALLGAIKSFYIPNVIVGKPKSPHLSWMMFPGTMYEGSRGIKAIEDKSNYGFSSRVTLQLEDLIVPMFNEVTGEKITYRLEPALPLVGTILREGTTPLVIPFKFPSGSLAVKIRKPDGTIDNLDPFPFQQGQNSLYSGSQFNQYRNIAHDGNIYTPQITGEMYELTTLNSKLNRQFDQFGRHIIEVNGTVKDIWGNEYTGGGTYGIYIAKPLDMDLGVFHGTPFEVGDVYSPVVHVLPGIPADVEIRFRLFVNSDKDNVIEKVITGKANKFGYFYPQTDNDRIVLSDPGEYIVDVKVSYTDDQGILWMGAARGASIVEATDTPLIAHGQRGIVAEDDFHTSRPQWYQEGRSGSVIKDGDGDCAIPQSFDHLPVPYNRGDILWAVEDCQSEIVALTFQDTEGTIANLMVDRQPCILEGCGLRIAPNLLPVNLVAEGEIPLFSNSTTGFPVGSFPEFVDEIGYFYTANIRPGLKARSFVAESLGTTYWPLDDPYFYQFGQGNLGDLENDIKLHFGGVVFRDLNRGINEYAIYASMAVFIPQGTERSNRVLPPFRGNGGGPDGGPILTLKGKEIGIFITPTGVTHGSILEVGDTFSFAGQMWPTLDSVVNYTVIFPDGDTKAFSGRANKIGYYYRPDDDFVVTAPGIYTVNVKVFHDGKTSAGQVEEPFPSGNMLGSDAGSFDFYVVERDSPLISLDIDRTSIIEPPGRSFPINATIPSDISNAHVRFSVGMIDLLLEEGTLPIAENRFSYTFDPIRLHKNFPNLEISTGRNSEDGNEFVDTVTMGFLITGNDIEGESVSFGRNVLLQGNRLLALNGSFVNPNIPIADAGIDQSVDGGSQVQLDGVNSHDPNSKTLSFQWKQVGGTDVELSDPFATKPRFISQINPRDQTFIFKLIVNNGSLNSSPDYVSVHVRALITPTPTPTPLSTPTPIPAPTLATTPTITPSPAVTFTPTASPVSTVIPTPTSTPPQSGKSFTLNCKRNFVIGQTGIGKLILKLGEEEECVLKLIHLEPETSVEVSTNLRTGLKSSIKVNPIRSVTDINGELKITITAMRTGVDWVAWTIPNEKGEFEFSKRAYDTGLAWGMFVEVR